MPRGQNKNVGDKKKKNTVDTSVPVQSAEIAALRRASVCIC